VGPLVAELCSGMEKEQLPQALKGLLAASPIVRAAALDALPNVPCLAEGVSCFATPRACLGNLVRCSSSKFTGKGFQQQALQGDRRFCLPFASSPNPKEVAFPHPKEVRAAVCDMQKGWGEREARRGGKGGEEREIERERGRERECVRARVCMCVCRESECER
jgi:hypothetical protein